MILSKELIDRLINAKSISILTGAGVSAESGISTFRDKDGLWSQFNPLELASIDGFMQNPERVWQWYQYRRNILKEAIPNSGHFALAQMEKLYPNFTLITQNVDRLHQQAGSKNVLELHGNIVENKCFECNRQHLEEIDTQEFKILKCKYCGGKIRPCVVWFGENLPKEELKNSEIAAMQSEIFILIGTSAEVYPAASLPLIAKEYGAYLIEINPNKSPISQYADVYINGKSGEILPELVNAVLKSK